MYNLNKINNDTYRKMEADIQSAEHQMKNYSGQTSKEERNSKKILLYILIGFTVAFLYNLFF